MSAPKTTWIARRVPEYGWAPFDRETGDKLIGDELGPWWPTRRHLLAWMADR